MFVVRRGAGAGAGAVAGTGPVEGAEEELRKGEEMVEDRDKKRM